MTTMTDRYLVPNGFTRRAFNPLVAWLTRRGISVAGSRVLEVRGRTTGELRAVPVNLLTVDGVDYLVAPRGHTQWVRNLRAAGEGRLRVGRRVEPFTAAELGDADKPAVIRRYLERWAWEVGAFFDDIDKHSTDEQLLAAAPGFPVFRITR
jgi:deazaflavin-dependent oxidoreductase (nitroreductase family)